MTIRFPLVGHGTWGGQREHPVGTQTCPVHARASLTARSTKPKARDEHPSLHLSDRAHLEQDHRFSLDAFQGK